MDLANVLNNKKKEYIPMRKILSILLCAAMLMTMVVFAGCDNKEDDKAETLKFGFAVEASVAAVESATADKEGKGEAVVNAYQD